MSSTSHKKTPSPSPLTLHTHAFISAFIAGSPPAETLSKYFTPTASIHEHGPEWARERLPFLAKTFTGRSSSSSSSSSSASLTTTNATPTIKTSKDQNNQDSNNGETMDDYYALLSSILRFKPSSETLPPLDAFNVDEEKGVVSVCLEGGFESLGTGRAWVERFVYLVGFEGVGEGEGGQGEGKGEGKGERKIQRLDLWADPLSAWVAVGGGDEGEGGGDGKPEGGGYGGVGAVGGV